MVDESASKVISYRQLNVYRKSYALALEVHKLTLGFPKMEQYELAAQLRRASRSIVANLVEGLGRQDSSKEVTRFVRMSMGSCDESRLWLEFAKDLGYIDPQIYYDYEKRYEEIGRMLRGVINYHSEQQSEKVKK